MKKVRPKEISQKCIVSNSMLCSKYRDHETVKDICLKLTRKELRWNQGFLMLSLVDFEQKQLIIRKSQTLILSFSLLEKMTWL